MRWVCRQDSPYILHGDLWTVTALTFFHFLTGHYRGPVMKDWVHLVWQLTTGKSICHGDSGGPLTVKSQFTEKHNLVGVSSWTYGCAAVSGFSLFMIFLILLLRMDCMGCMQRWPSTGLGLMRRLLLMEAHLFALHNFLRFPMKLFYQSVTSSTSFIKMIIEVKSNKIV